MEKFFIFIQYLTLIRLSTSWAVLREYSHRAVLMSMRLYLPFLLATIVVVSSLAHADEISPADGSFIARIKAGPGFYSGLSPVSATLGLGIDAGYRSFEGFGIIAVGDLFPSITSGDSSV